MGADLFLTRLLQILGAGFLVANVRLLFQFLRFRRIRRSAELIWPGPKPPLYGLLLALGVTLGVLLFYKLGIQRQPFPFAFGEAMMFVYYGYALPLSLRIGRGFYQDGIWTDGGYMPYSDIGGLSWREDQATTLVLIYRMRQLARRLVVPEKHYAAARRILRDRIAEHDIHFTGKGLELGDHDERDVV